MQEVVWSHGQVCQSTFNLQIPFFDSAHLNAYPENSYLMGVGLKADPYVLFSLPLLSAVSSVSKIEPADQRLRRATDDEEDDNDASTLNFRAKIIDEDGKFTFNFVKGFAMTQVVRSMADYIKTYNTKCLTQF